MTIPIFLFSASSFLFGLVSIILGSYVLIRSRDYLNRFYFVLTFMIFVEGIIRTFMRAAPSSDLANFWHILSISIWIFYFAFILHFILIFYRMKIKYIYLLFIYIPPFIMSALFAFTPYYISGYQKYFYGYDYIPGPWNPSYLLYYMLYVLIGAYFIIKVYKEAKEFYRRKQAQVVLVAIFIPLIVGTLSNQVFLMLKIPTLPLAIHFVAIFVWFIGFAILRYQPVFEVSKERIAEIAAYELLDPMFLTDITEKINYVNPAACKLSGFRSDELLGKDIKEIIPESDKEVATLLRKRDSRVVINLSRFSLLENQGFVYLARDLSKIIRHEESNKMLNAELQKLLAREQNIMKILFQLSEVKEQEEVEELWRGVNLKEHKIVSTLEPVYKMVREYARIYSETQEKHDEILQKTKEVERLNRYMSGREEVLGELQGEYKRLKG